jgi:hypothetical protein
MNFNKSSGRLIRKIQLFLLPVMLRSQSNKGLHHFSKADAGTVKQCGSATMKSMVFLIIFFLNSLKIASEISRYLIMQEKKNQI